MSAEQTEFITLDTRAFDQALEKAEGFITTYQQLNDTYDNIVKTLSENWEGAGAEAFTNDATQVKKNIVGIYDILKAMCDTLKDCKDIFAECDHMLNEYNISQ